jgi:hypothetical protein
MKSTLQLVSEEVAKHLVDYGLTLTDPKQLTIAQGEALARMFGDNVLRSVFENLITVQNKNLISSTTELQHIYFKARMDTLLQLLEMGRAHFINFEMIRKKPLTEEQRVKSIEAELTDKK